MKDKSTIELKKEHKDLMWQLKAAMKYGAGCGLSEVEYVKIRITDLQDEIKRRGEKI